MSKKWEINRVSTAGRILDKINHEMAQPVSVVLFGADSELKDDVLADLRAGLSDARVFHGAPSTYEMVELLHSGKISIFVLSSMESTDHELRHECVKVMRNIGAKSVVGVYVKMDSSKNGSLYKMPETKAVRKEVERCMTKLKNHPPTADGLDYLLVVSEE